jgi:putative DNA primase/helicase
MPISLFTGDTVGPSLEEIRSQLAECVILSEKKNEIARVDRPRCVHTLLDNLHIRTSVKADRKKGILIYYNGRYEPDGDITIEKLLSHAFLDILTKDGKPIFSTTEKNEILARIKELTPTIDSFFDAGLSIINMTNGLYNWKTGERRPHDPNYLSRIQIPVIYDPEATCPTIEKFLDTVLRPEDIPKIIEFAGYCLYRGYPVQKAFILLGKGGTGKSFLIDILRSFVGEENAFGISPQDLTKIRFASADLYRKLLDAVPDVGSEKMEQTAAIKALTGHKDKVRAERKYQDPFEFINYAKMIFGLNEIPETKDKTSGWYRRIEIIRMEHVLGQTEFSKEFIKNLTSPEELSGLFNLAIKMLPGLLERNAFTNEMQRDDTAEEYEAASNPIEYFCETFLMNVPGEVITKEALFERYKEFCRVAGASVPKSGNKLGMHLHRNVHWLVGRPKKDEVARVKEGGDPVAVWPDTQLGEEAFEAWMKSHLI